MRRRHFLSGMAVLGATPLYREADLLSWLAPADEQTFTGDNFDEAHEFLRNPRIFIDTGNWQRNDVPYDVIVVGGGISGLTTAYRLVTQPRAPGRVLLLEREQKTGGVSKSDTWNGIEYAIGAAYIVKPDPGKENEKFLLDLDLLADGENIGQQGGTPDRSKKRRISSGDNHCVFTDTEVLKEDLVYSEENVAFFREGVLWGENYPEIPVQHQSLVDTLDAISFTEMLANKKLQRELYGREVGAMSKLGQEAIEYYFWGAFGTSAVETSAYHGLNFFAAEFDQVLSYPGGNAFIARRIAERLQNTRADVVQTSHYVLRVQREPDGRLHEVLSYHDGCIHRFLARAVVFASPLFLAKRIVTDLPDEQRDALDTLDYRSYVVANVLLNRRMGEIFANPAFSNGYELTHVHRIDVSRTQPDEISSRKIFSDVVVADFPVWGAPRGGVLTVYRPYPYSYGRDRLRYLSYSHIEEEVRRAVIEGFSHHGLREADIAGIRLTRWGHPMIIPRPGQITAKGAVVRARQSRPGLYFSHTDTQGAPAFENALAAANDAVKRVNDHLR